MSKMAYIDYLCSTEDKKGLLEELGTETLAMHYLDNYKTKKTIENKIKKGKPMKISTGVLTKTEIVNSYISSYNRGRLEYKGFAHKRMLALIDRFWSEKNIRYIMLSKINHKIVKELQKTRKQEGE